MARLAFTTGRLLAQPLHPTSRALAVEHDGPAAEPLAKKITNRGKKPKV